MLQQHIWRFSKTRRVVQHEAEHRCERVVFVELAQAQIAAAQLLEVLRKVRSYGSLQLGYFGWKTSLDPKCAVHELARFVLAPDYTTFIGHPNREAYDDLQENDSTAPHIEGPLP